jgi:flagellar assembly factor FliW
MEQNELIIDTRLGPMNIDKGHVVHFPRGLAGFEGEHDFALLQIRPGSPMLILQSVTNSAVGLLVADPYSFLDSYSIYVGDAEQKLLKITSVEEAAVLVTVSIPPGEPEKAVLNLLGPIVINHKAHLGVQVPQQGNAPTQVNLCALNLVAGKNGDKSNAADESATLKSEEV